MRIKTYFSSVNYISRHILFTVIKTFIPMQNTMKIFSWGKLTNKLAQGIFHTLQTDVFPEI